MSKPVPDSCEVCGSDDVDDYGCIDCFILALAAKWYSEEEEEDADTY